jgi:hypothetical protein
LVPEFAVEPHADIDRPLLAAMIAHHSDLAVAVDLGDQAAAAFAELPRSAVGGRSVQSGDAVSNGNSRKA